MRKNICDFRCIRVFARQFKRTIVFGCAKQIAVLLLSIESVEKSKQAEDEEGEGEGEVGR